MVGVDGFLATAEPLPEPLLLLQLNGEILAANSAAGKMLDASPNELTGRLLQELTVDPAEELGQFQNRCGRSRGLLPGRLTLRGTDGESRAVRIDGALFRPRQDDAGPLVLLRLRSQDQTITSFQLLNEQITELQREIGRRRQIEHRHELLLESEREARARAEDADKTKDEFLASLSHELRAPLQAIANWVYLLRQPSLDSKTKTRALETIERNLTLQTQLINDLLDITHISAGQIHLEKETVDLTSLVDQVCAGLRQEIEEKGIELQQTLAPAVAVEGDPVRLRQVIWILLSNAVKFTRDSGRIELSLEADEKRARVTVRDNGTGIDSETLARLFEPFHQADASRTRLHGGLGLGLAISRHLVELQGGTILAESEGVGRGATFTLELPRTLIDESDRE